MKKDWMITETELDDDQIIFMQQTLDKSCIVSGCAGSGKSVLALHKVRQIQDRCGADYKVIVYTKALCQYMNTGRVALGLSNEFLYHDEWRWQHVSRGGVTLSTRVRDGNGDPIPYMPAADYIIVDEVQDFDQKEISEFISASRKHFFFFGDTAQSLYANKKQTVPVDKIPALIPADRPYKPFWLCRNYRLPIPVARIAHPIGVPGEPFVDRVYKSQETAMPRFLKYDNLGAQIAAIDRIIKRDGLTDVAILLQDNQRVNSVYQALIGRGVNCEVKCSEGADWSAKYNLDFGSTNPKVMTYHSAKGLQFEAVFLPFMECYSEPHGLDDRTALYVALTRTYRYLYVMYSEHLTAPLSDVDPMLYKSEEMDHMEEI